MLTCGSNGDKFVYRNVLERISECFSKEKNFTWRGKQLQSWNLKHKHKCTKTKLYNKMYKYVPKKNLALYSPIQEKFCFYMKLFRDLLTMWWWEEEGVGKEYKTEEKLRTLNSFI